MSTLATRSQAAIPVPVAEVKMRTGPNHRAGRKSAVDNASSVFERAARPAPRNAIQSVRRCTSGIEPGMPRPISCRPAISNSGSRDIAARTVIEKAFSNGSSFRHVAAFIVASVAQGPDQGPATVRCWIQHHRPSIPACFGIRPAGGRLRRRVRRGRDGPGAWDKRLPLPHATHCASLRRARSH